MNRLEFDDKLKLGVPAIDQQHEHFIGIIDEAWEIHQAGNASGELLPVLGALIDYALKHFSDEEELMRKFDYPDYLEHKEMHDQTTHDLFGFDVRLLSDHPEEAQAFLNFLASWLGKHIQEIDKKLAAFLIERGVAG